jgi:hypothetical protein
MANAEENRRSLNVSAWLRMELHAAAHGTPLDPRGQGVEPELRTIVRDMNDRHLEEILDKDPEQFTDMDRAFLRMYFGV